MFASAMMHALEVLNSQDAGRSTQKKRAIKIPGWDWKVEKLQVMTDELPSQPYGYPHSVVCCFNTHFGIKRPLVF